LLCDFQSGAGALGFLAGDGGAVRGNLRGEPPLVRGLGAHAVLGLDQLLDTALCREPALLGLLGFVRNGGRTLLARRGGGHGFVGEQLSRDPASGNLYRIFVNATSERYGIDARLLGKVSADPQTGRVTTTFDDGVLGSVKLAGLPQVPFESFRIKLDGGPTATLTSPPTCGPNTTGTEMTPWSSARGLIPPGAAGGPSADTSVPASSAFSLSDAPGGGACAGSLGERPFDLGFDAGTDSPGAGSTG